MFIRAIIFFTINITLFFLWLMAIVIIIIAIVSIIALVILITAIILLKLTICEVLNIGRITVIICHDR